MEKGKKSRDTFGLGPAIALVGVLVLAYLTMFVEKNKEHMAVTRSLESAQVEPNDGDFLIVEGSPNWRWAEGEAPKLP